MKFASRIRHAYIDWHLKRHGGINRAHLQAAFEISPAQASKDLSEFAKRHKGRMTYNLSRKVYEPTPRWGRQIYADEQHHCARLAVKLFLQEPQP